MTESITTEDSIIEAIKAYCNKHEKYEKETLIQIASIVYALENPENDLYMLSKKCDEKTIQTIISNFAGQNLKIPTIKTYNDSMILAVCYYLFNIKKFNWLQIQSYLQSSNNLPEDSSYFKKIQKKIKNINLHLAQRGAEILKKLEEKDIIDE
jgi:hypothetical protein